MRRKYVGPMLADLRQPATWATRQMPQPVAEDGRAQRGQAPFMPLPQFTNQWVFITSLDRFANRADPSTFYKVDQFNIQVRPFSDVKDTADLLHRLVSVKVHGVVYDPSMPAGIVTVDRKRMLNVHVPSGVEPKPGDPRPFLRYLRHLIPNRKDRRNVERWIATLLARPDIRMLFGLMLTSRRHGVGKSTLFEYILGPLLGSRNCSSTTAQEVTSSQFTDWIANKRLVVIDEVYAGHSSETANAIKPKITSKDVKVNRKFLEPYEVRNWAHFVIMSNSRTPLFVDDEDRRWAVPEVTEELKPLDYWLALHRWLNTGGLAVILHWAHCFVKSKRGPFLQGAHAPDSSTKSALIEASRSDGKRLIRDLAEWLVDIGQGPKPTRVILPIAVLKQWFRGQEQLAAGDKKMSERAILEALPPSLRICRGDDRCDTGKRKLAVIINFDKTPEETWPHLIREERCLWDLNRLSEAFDAL